MNCPKCGMENDDNWPLDIGGVIMEGGCQICWEAACDDGWWKQGAAPNNEIKAMKEEK